MANTITVNALGLTPLQKTKGNFRVTGIIVLSGSYVASPTGEILDFSKAVMPLGYTLPVNKQPISIDIWGNIGVSYEPIGPLGGAGLKVPIKIVAATVSGSTPTVNELSAGAYNALIIADFIQFEAVFDANI